MLQKTVLLLLVAAGASSAAEPERIKLDAAHWAVQSGATFSLREGFQDGILTLKSGRVTLKNVTFGDGTIAFDVKPTGGFAGVTFHRADALTSEEFYIRPGPDCAASQDCIQYAPETHGVMMWDSYPAYQAPAPITPSAWNHIRLVISGRRMAVYVNGLTAPSLSVGRLEGDATRGALQFYGSGAYANVTVEPDVVDGLSPVALPDPTASDARYIRDWRVSPPSALQTTADPVHSGPDPRLADMPGEDAPWQTIIAERGGMINLDRAFGSPTPPWVRALVWLKTSIESDRTQTKTVSLGWAREIWIYSNGQPVFAGRNLYEPESLRRYPDGRLSIENGTFQLPLQKGRNEIVVALDNNMPDDETHFDRHYAWGLEMRVDDSDGLRPGSCAARSCVGVDAGGG